MFRSFRIRVPLRTCIFGTGTDAWCAHRESGSRLGVTLSAIRSASRSSQPPSVPQAKSTKKPVRRRGEVPNTTKSELDASRKASLLLSRLSKSGKQSAEQRAEKQITEPEAENKNTESKEAQNSTEPEAEKVVVKKPAIFPGYVAKPPRKANDEDTAETIEIDEQEIEIQKRIVANRTKLLWPGIWTFFAVFGTYSAFAYLDAKFGGSTPEGAELSERTELPRTWYLTPTIIKEGVKAGWKELDNLTIGIVVVTIGVQLMRRSPLPFWEKLIHITGEKRYTAFTYPFVHANWAHLSQNIFILCWFMPGVVRYLDGDLYHTAALFVTVPLLTSYLQHFAFRWNIAGAGLPMNMGSSGAIAAMFGAFCMAFPHEKLWLPNLVFLRFDAMYWGLGFAIWQIASRKLPNNGGSRPAFLVSQLRCILCRSLISLDSCCELGDGRCICLL